MSTKSNKKSQQNRKQQDEILFCERCGISFLWSTEEQILREKAETTEKIPTLCPGCRHLLPSAERERGLVKWYNPRKRYGFITRQDGADAYAHRDQLRGTKRLQPGDLVEFTIQSSERGMTARKIRLLQKAGDRVIEEES